MPHINPADLTALGLFLIAWFAYEPVLRRVSRGEGAINTNMTVVRRAWMRNMASRELKLVDSQLMGHVINSASFFASTPAGGSTGSSGSRSTRVVIGVLRDRRPARDAQADGSSLARPFRVKF